MRALPALALLLTIAASAQPAEADRLGLYAVVGSAAPERSLFREPADPVVTLGYRFSDLADVQVGVRFDENDSIVRRDRLANPTRPIYVDLADRTKAIAASVGIEGTERGAAFRLRGSLAYDVYDRTLTTELYEIDSETPVQTQVDEASGTFAHAGLSTIVGVPLGREAARITPGLGAAVSSSRRVGGTLTAPSARAMAFLSLPTTVEAGPALVTLDARLGMARPLKHRTNRPERWSPVVEAGVRVEI
jgi:hypothetical protein